MRTLFISFLTALLNLVISPAFAQDIRDVKGPVDYPLNLWLVLLFFLIAAGIAAVLLFRFFKKRRKKPSVPVVQDTRTPRQKALDALAALRKKGFLAEKDFEPYYLELSQIVRTYIEEEFRIRAPEMTTEEFLNSLKGASAIGPEHKEILKEFLISSDMVKFARYAPAVEEADKSFELARKLVEETSHQSVVTERERIENPSQS